MHHQV